MLGNIDILIKELSKLPKEVGWVEFKHNNCEPSMVVEDISALANSATRLGQRFNLLVTY